SKNSLKFDSIPSANSILQLLIVYTKTYQNNMNLMKKSRFKYLIVTIMPLISMAGAVYAQQTNAAVTAVSNKAIRVDDDNETSKPNAYQLFGYGDSKLDSINKQVDY